MAEFKAGDVVQLKSGGPAMTVDYVGTFGLHSKTVKARCVWFDGKAAMKQIYELASLKTYDPETDKRVVMDV